MHSCQQNDRFHIVALFLGRLWLTGSVSNGWCECGGDPLCAVLQGLYTPSIRRCARRTNGVVVRAAAEIPIAVEEKAKVPLEMEEMELPLNTFSPKKPFKAKIKSVERIVGPKATGETCHIVIETNGDIPFWEGQSYGVIPPVRSANRRPRPKPKPRTNLRTPLSNSIPLRSSNLSRASPLRPSGPRW